LEGKAFEKAREIAVEKLREKDLREVAARAGAEAVEGHLRLPYLGRWVRISPPNFEAFYEGGGRLPPKRELIILHYLVNSTGTPPSGRLIDFRQIPSGSFYYPVFAGTVERPLLQRFGQKPERIEQALLRIGGCRAGLGDVSATVNVLPHIPLTFVFHKGDEEFPPACKILFDSTITEYFDIEDVRILCEDVVELLCELAKEER